MTPWTDPLGYLAALLAAADVQKALVGAILTTIGTVLLFVLRGVGRAVAAVLAERSRNLTIFRRFHAVVDLAAGDLARNAEQTREDYALDIMRRFDRDRGGFRFFRIGLVEHDDKDAMRQISHKFGRDETAAIERFVYLSKFLDSFYDRLDSKEFADLPPSRKEQVVRTYYRYMREHRDNAAKVKLMLEQHPWSSDTAVARMARSLGRTIKALIPSERRG